MFIKNEVRLSKEKIILNLLIIFIILSNAMEIYFIVSDVPKEIVVNGEEIIAVFGRFSKFVFSLSSILAMILMIYPLFSLKKIICSIDNEEAVSYTHLDVYKRQVAMRLIEIQRGRYNLSILKKKKRNENEIR